MRAVPMPRRRGRSAPGFLPDWDARAWTLARELAAGRPAAVDGPRCRPRSRPRRRSRLAGDCAGRRWLRCGYLRLAPAGPEPCLLLVGARRHGPGSSRRPAARRRRSSGEHGGVGVGRRVRAALATRAASAAPYLRNALWDAGYAVDTLETATDWTPAAPELAAALGRPCATGLEGDGRAGPRVQPPVPRLPDRLEPVRDLRLPASPPTRTRPSERWRRLKTAASEAIVAHGGTISHQHGVGRDHGRTWRPRRASSGMAALARVADRFDPDGLMDPGVLLGRPDPP